MLIQHTLCMCIIQHIKEKCLYYFKVALHHFHLLQFSLHGEYHSVCQSSLALEGALQTLEKKQLILMISP